MKHLPTKNKKNYSSSERALKIGFLAAAAFISLTSTFSLSAASAAEQCSSIFTPPVLTQITWDLLQLKQEETLGKNRIEVAAMNAKTVSALYANNEGLNPHSKRRLSLSLEQIHGLIKSIDLNPVIASSNNGGYKQPSVDIGYCFGRATYAHLALLKMGVDKSAIRKAWVVGKMESGGLNWQFHVATLVRGNDNKWYAVDNYFQGRALEISDWTQAFVNENREGDVRLYVTDARKFSVNLGVYDKLQLGLNLDKQNDWYQGFFADLMQWFRNDDLNSVGLSKLPPR